jgi:hypothetical protein
MADTAKTVAIVGGVVIIGIPLAVLAARMLKLLNMGFGFVESLTGAASSLGESIAGGFSSVTNAVGNTLTGGLSDEERARLLIERFPTKAAMHDAGDNGTRMFWIHMQPQVAWACVYALADDLPAQQEYIARVTWLSDILNKPYPLSRDHRGDDE